MVRGNKSELVAAADGPARERAPTSPSPGLFLGLDAAMADEDEVDEDVPLSRRHSSLWPARQAARWQAWPQYLRCLHPVQKCSLSFSARVWQFAHTSLIALGTVLVGVGWFFILYFGTGLGAVQILQVASRIESSPAQSLDRGKPPPAIPGNSRYSPRVHCHYTFTRKMRQERITFEITPAQKYYCSFQEFDRPEGNCRILGFYFGVGSGPPTRHKPLVDECCGHCQWRSPRPRRWSAPGTPDRRGTPRG